MSSHLSATILATKLGAHAAIGIGSVQNHGPSHGEQHCTGPASLNLQIILVNLLVYIKQIPVLLNNGLS